MDGIHDLGGLAGFGAVEVEPDEPVFHEPWESRVFGLNAAIFASGRFSGGRFRHAIERMDPVHYLTSSYYEHWLTGTTTLLVEAGVLGGDELEASVGGLTWPLSRPGPPDLTVVARADRLEPRFAIGDRVRVRTRGFAPTRHTRCPRYVRGREGVVVRADGTYSVPDIEAHAGPGERVEEPTYSVRFDAAELWGEPAEPAVTVCVDLWEGYLEKGTTP